MATSSFEYWSASGLTGVWAEENTREAIYRAFRRRETFATSGPRLQVRFFAFTADAPTAAQLDSPELISHAYARGEPMGGEVIGSERALQFLLWANAAPEGARLQRMQLVKGSVVDGEHRERIYDVACSDGLQPDPQTHRCPDNGARVDLADCSISAGVGAGELKTLWRDPDFDPQREAIYYLRVLENPVCRWSTWDAIRAGEAPRPDLPATLQERAWSSPIWYRPGS